MRSRPGIRRCLRALGYFYLAEGGGLEGIVERVQRTMEEDESVDHTAAHLLALRARMTGASADIERARKAARTGLRVPEWIPTEVWLEDLGHPLDPVETQWLIPYEQVRDNWLRIGDGIIERAKKNATDR